MAKIKKIIAREILDSKGTPTIEVELWTEKHYVVSRVPSGVSVGRYEAHELRDKGKRYFGKGVLKAVSNINNVIAPRIKGKNCLKQEEIDNFLISLDGTKNKSSLGANAILGVSQAVCRAGAKTKGVPLFFHIADLFFGKKTAEKGNFFLPLPMILMIEGGLHGGTGLEIQEFMIVPFAKTFRERLRIGTEFYYFLKRIISEKYGPLTTNVGYEGGFSPALKNNKEALELILEAKTKQKKEIKISLDVAASVFYKNKKYVFEKKFLSFGQLLDFYKKLVFAYPILSLEDPFAETDYQGWQKLNQSLGNKILVVGDDLLATNPKRIEMAKKKNLCQGVILKINQIGTITEALKVAKMAKDYGWKIIVSHRSGETTDDFIADLAVGIGAEFVKFGAPNRGERIAKYNRLLKIEELL